MVIDLIDTKNLEKIQAKLDDDLEKANTYTECRIVYDNPLCRRETCKEAILKMYKFAKSLDEDTFILNSCYADTYVKAFVRERMRHGYSSHNMRRNCRLVPVYE